MKQGLEKRVSFDREVIKEGSSTVSLLLGNLPAMKTPGGHSASYSKQCDLSCLNYPEVIANSFFSSWKVLFVVVKLLLDK